MRPRAQGISVFILLISLTFLAGPASASANVFVVNSTGDQTDASPGDDGCETAAATCTLRTAIEEANAGAEADTVHFDSSFDGTSGSVIDLGSSLPTVSSPLVIQGDAGGFCKGPTQPVQGPCVGIVGAEGEPVLVVDAAPALVSGLAITGGSIGIELEEHAGGAELRDDWTGIGLDQSPGANEIGILVGPGVVGAKIGGDTVAKRNVVGNSTDTGIELRGASDARISGNYVGVAPDGESAAPNGTGVEVASVTPAGPNATGDVIGGSLTPEEAESPVCDGPCNVISGSLGSGIDLTGRWPQTFVATGPTTIAGNYVGLDAAGARGIANAETGIVIGEAPYVTIGGSNAALEGNHVNGGEAGISSGTPFWDPSGRPNGARIEGNSIGLDPQDRALLAPPHEFGVLNAVPQQIGGGERAQIVDNRISMTEGEGIREEGTGTKISANEIGVGAEVRGLPGAAIGIHLEGSDFYGSSLVQDNEVANSSEYGILIENDKNLVIGNRIAGAGINGIRIVSPVWGHAGNNTIGENAPSSEDTIDDSGAAAIALLPGSARENVVGRVSGSGNGGLFVDYGPVGPGSGEPLREAREKDGIPFASVPFDAPTITRLTPTTISGKGPPGEVHIYAKSGPSPGQLGRQMAVVEARQTDSGWIARMPMRLRQGRIAVGENVPFLGSSELRIVKFDFKAPRTRIVSHPKRRSHRRTAKFGFRANEKDSTFECNLDRRHFRPCRSPVSYRHLRPGKHVFRVRGTDAAGNRAKAPAHWRFRVLR